MTNSKVFWSILTAAAAGAAIGMLFAPEQGDQTRKKIKKSANDWASDVLDSLEKGKVKVQDAADRLVKNGAALKDEAVETADERLGDARTKINKMN
ncbi:YtxH domain-containing protein [Arundinibacter roseus]|uniref:YtxH domain-containing protein n=1 Tax=Arundinibacter roseus TaxID=2070510 RepID=A0A4R4KEE7_9BACT|nr:YtxH domain-containing protein [Arundinibacter roseus]TDB65192.1 YtxH domain-containing protein [Arundinibacter roseus]